MLTFRRILAYLLTIFLIFNIFLISLLVNFNLNIKNETKIKNLINKPQIYSEIIKKINNEANAAISSQYKVSGLNEYVSSSVKSIYPENVFNDDVNKIIDSNYSWVKGQSATPNFSINLISIRQNLANKAAGFVISSTENLPLCSELQLIELQNNGPSSENCLPPTLQPKSLAASVKKEILNSDVFSNQAFLTAKSVKLSSANEPYYQKLSSLPKYYRWAVKGIYILIASLLVLILLIFLLLPLKRAAFKLTAWAILISGVLLLLFNVAANQASEKLIAKVSSSQTLSDFHMPADSFITGLCASIVKINRDLGIVYFLFSVLLLLAYFIYRKIAKKREGASVYTRSGGTLGSGTFHLFLAFLCP